MLIFLIPLFLCWGSFLNVLGYRLIHNVSIIRPPSHCIHCKNLIAWYDNIPLFSWLSLRGKCRTCKKSISILYPFIELLTAIAMSALYIVMPLPFFFTYFIFFSALIVTIRSDIETMLISRFATLLLVPLGFVFSYLQLISTTIFDSIIGSFVGYFFLYAVGWIFKKATGKSGIGQGDLDLLAYIGSFTGLVGCWASLLFGSILGSISGFIYLLLFKLDRNAKIPFGPFLAIGAILFVLFKKPIIPLLIFYQ